MRETYSRYTYLWAVYAILTVGLFLLLLHVAPAAAVTTSSAAISQSYPTSSSIGAGELVSLAPSGLSGVEPATLNDASDLVGVAADAPALQLSHGTKGSVQVVTGGSATVLVSDANGPVKLGDKITISPLAGIGMKAISSAEIVGTAQRSLSSVKTISEQFKGKDGKQVSVRVGQLPVAVNVVYYSAASSAGSISAFVPPFLQSVASSIAGKAVSPLRVLISSVALLLGFISVALMLYAGVRDGVISLGRNPLAADALRRGMVDVMVAALGVLVVTCVAVVAIVAA